MKLATALLAAIFAVSLAGAAPASANGYSTKHHVKMTKKHAHKRFHRRSPRVAGWVTRGGFLNGDQNTPFVYANGRNPDSTSFDTRSFGNRVFDGPFNSQR
jgi:hypothetical protein